LTKEAEQRRVLFDEEERGFLLVILEKKKGQMGDQGSQRMPGRRPGHFCERDSAGLCGQSAPPQDEGKTPAYPFPHKKEGKDGPKIEDERITSGRRTGSMYHRRAREGLYGKSGKGKKKGGTGGSWTTKKWGLRKMERKPGRPRSQRPSARSRASPLGKTMQGMLQWQQILGKSQAASANATEEGDSNILNRLRGY